MQVCGDKTDLPMVTPCAHLLCTDCTAVSRTACPVSSCGHAYDMQATNDPARYSNNPDPKWEVGGSDDGVGGGSDYDVGVELWLVYKYSVLEMSLVILLHWQCF